MAELARSIDPERDPPRYVAGSIDGHPDGWYWTSPDRAEYLGRNVIFAERRLLSRLVNGQPKTQ